MSQPSISVVIRCFNEERHIGKLLHGIRQQAVGDAEIVVVDSGSTDRTVETALEYDVQLIRIEPNDFSFGRALNIGCEAATGEFVVVASAHVYPVYEDWLERLVRPFSDPDVAAVYGKQRGAETTRYSEHQVFHHWYPDDAPVRQDHPFCNNANCAIRRDLWRDVPYDETLTGLEDLAWAEAVSDRGYRIAYAPRAEIIHVHEETPLQIMRRYMREAIALKRIYPEQEMTLGDFLRLFITNTATDYAHAAVDGVLLSNVIDIPRFRLMQFLGAFRGFRRSGPVSQQLRRKFYYPRTLPRRERDESGRDGARRIVYP